MERLTQPESQIKSILEGLGYPVKWWSQQSVLDPYNIIYMQMHISRIGSRRPFCADFALHYAQISIEVDGEYWHRDFAIEGKIRDQDRDRELRGMGWKIIRFPSSMIDRPGITTYIASALHQLIDV